MGKAKRKAASNAASRYEAARMQWPTGFACGALVILVLWQGGFYATPLLLIGGICLAVACVRFAMGHGGSVIPAALLACVGAAHLASGFIAGITPAMTLESLRWFALAGFALLVGDDEYDRQSALGIIARAGVVLAAIAIFAWCGETFAGAGAQRLSLYYQYANASGAFFAIATLLCLANGGRNLKVAAAVPAVAMLMTLSVGAISLFCIAFLAFAFLRAGEESCEHKVLTVLIPVATVVLVVAVTLLIFPDRLAQAQGTFAERLAMMGDAVALLAAHPMGVGPDGWASAYPAIQTTDYVAMKVHCSYLQVALDAGVIGVLLFASLAAVGLVSLARRRQWHLLVCALLLLVHAAFDFDFCYGSLVMLLTTLAFGMEESSHP